MTLALPPDLLQAVACPEGGRIVLILGAGCSIEPPTKVPLARQCATDACRRLVADGVLTEGECTDPQDLSALAELVKAKTGKQIDLVRRLPEARFRNAPPNNGHKDGVALLIEGAVSNVITLNFDLALSHALSDLDAGSAVSVLKGPEDHHAFSNANIIYLHRNVDVDAEQWVLTKTSLDTAWINGWEQLVATMATATPIVVFAGMGSSCGVLRDSIERLRMALGKAARVLFVDPSGAEWSKFAKELNLSAADCIEVGWVDFMRALSQRLASEHGSQISAACNALIESLKWPAEDIAGLCGRLVDLGLVGIGKLRASWLLESGGYSRHRGSNVDFLADLLLAVGFIERNEASKADVMSDGVVEISTSDGRRISLILASGGGKRWTSLEAEFKLREKYRPQDSAQRRPRRVLVSNVTGGDLTTVSPPVSIVNTPDESSILDDQNSFKFWSADQIRKDPASLKELLA